MRKVGPFSLLVASALCAAALASGGGGAAELAPDATPAVRSPRVNYMLHCQGCHLPDGTGKVGAVPNMRGHLARFLTIAGGRQYIIQVPGVSTSKLNDADTARLMNWLVHEMGPEVPADFQPYTAQEVGALRARWLHHPETVRATLVKTMGEPHAAD